jgi:hypothetical protein
LTSLTVGFYHPHHLDTKTSTLLRSLFAVVLLGMASACSSISLQPDDVRPRVLRDVPAQRLAYRFEPDVEVPDEVKDQTSDDKIEAIQMDFNTRRQDDALIRTVRSPDGQRALVLYNVGDEASHTFHIDLYGSSGNFIRNVTPPDLACVFPESVEWSPDGNSITFIAHKNVKPSPTPTPPGSKPPEPLEAIPLPSVAPAFAPVQVFNTEQIYIANRDGYDLKPLTTREGLIYFYLSWAPDSHSLVALACREPEWDAREKEYKLPAGRPRLVNPDGTERLLDDGLTEALPVWSPDSSKVATAFETDVKIYDAAGAKPTQALIRFRDVLIAASRVFEERTAAAQEKNENSSESGGSSIPASFNPIVRLEWPTPEQLYVQTAYIRLLPNEPISTFQRWHLVFLSPQAALLR